MKATSNGRANSEWDTAEAEQKADGLSGPLLTAEVEGDRAEQTDEAAVEQSHAQRDQLQVHEPWAHCHQHCQQADSQK